MAYGLILIGAIVVLPIVYALHWRPSPRAKVILAALAIAAIAVPGIPGLVLKLAVSLFVLLYLRVFPIAKNR